MGESGPGSNGNKELLHSPQISRTVIYQDSCMAGAKVFYPLGCHRYQAINLVLQASKGLAGTAP